MYWFRILHVAVFVCFIHISTRFPYKTEMNCTICLLICWAQIKCLRASLLATLILMHICAFLFVIHFVIHLIFHFFIFNDKACFFFFSN
uniref:Uncharacterized protein n=1 Tax=Triticum urartu TaxID=4572 RepID=A0A8R7Q658_TRIUA